MEDNLSNKTEEQALHTSPATNDAPTAAGEEVNKATEETPQPQPAEAQTDFQQTESAATEATPHTAVPVEEAPAASPQAEEASTASTAPEAQTQAAEAPEAPAQAGNEATTAEAPAPAPEPEDDDATPQIPAEEHKPIQVPETIEGIIDRLNQLAEHPEQSEKTELDALKQAFYHLIKEEKIKSHQQFIQDGGKEEDFVPMPNLHEEEFKKVMAIIKEQRNKLQQEAEHQKEVNLQKKQIIIEKIKQYSATPEEANKAFETVRELQNQWKTINPVPAQAEGNLWKSYQFAVEQFYDQLKTNAALRDYDFKKNLEAKTKLCEEAEALKDDKDIIHASRILQELHQEFREIGPVAKELREDLWNRFKAASTAVNKRHAQYFEQLKAVEEENLKKKTELCEKIENIETDNLKNFPAWDEITKKIIELQTEWKGIGRATKKMNNKIYERYRAACDNFFNKKAEFFKAQRKLFAENAALKTQLCEKAEALKDSTEWTKTTNELIELQKQWKKIGATTHKASQALWERFNTACNAFFDHKKQVLGDQHKEEADNLAKKRDIIKQLRELVDSAVEDAASKAQQLIDEWNETGHVPFKEKDKLFNAFREVSDKAAEKFNLHRGHRDSSSRSRNSRESAAPRDGNTLYRLYEIKKSELNTYENNFSFLTAHSKKGNALIDQLQKKIDQLKKEVADTLQKLKEQDQAARQQAAQAAEAPAPTSEAPASDTPAPANAPEPVKGAQALEAAAPEAPAADAPAPAAEGQQQ